MCNPAHVLSSLRILWPLCAISIGNELIILCFVWMGKTTRETKQIFS